MAWTSKDDELSPKYGIVMVLKKKQSQEKLNSFLVQWRVKELVVLTGKRLCGFTLYGESDFRK